MKKPLLILFFATFLIQSGLQLPAIALETPEKQIQNALEEEKQEKADKTDRENKEDKPIDYKKLNVKTRLESGKARNHGHVSAGYEHVKSKYQAQQSLNRYKAEFQKQIKFEQGLLRGDIFSDSDPKKDKTTTDKDED